MAKFTKNNRKNFDIATYEFIEGKPSMHKKAWIEFCKFYRNYKKISVKGCWQEINMDEIIISSETGIIRIFLKNREGKNYPWNILLRNIMEKETISNGNVIGFVNKNDRIFYSVNNRINFLEEYELLRIGENNKVKKLYEDDFNFV